MSNLINIPCRVVCFHSILSLGPMEHVDFKKWPCRHVEFTDQEAHPSPYIRTIDIGASVCMCSSLYTFWDSSEYATGVTRLSHTVTDYNWQSAHV